MINKQTIEIVMKHLGFLNGTLEELETNSKHDKISIYYRDEYNNLHKLVIKSQF